MFGTKDVNGKKLERGQKVKILALGLFEDLPGTLPVGSVGVVDGTDAGGAFHICVEHPEGELEGFDFFRPSDLEIIEG